VAGLALLLSSSTPTTWSARVEMQIRLQVQEPMQVGAQMRVFVEAVGRHAGCSIDCNRTHAASHGETNNAP